MDKFPLRQEGMIGPFQYCIKDNQMGYLCGYLLIPQSFIDVKRITEDESYLDCHGGLNFSSKNLYIDKNTIVLKKYEGMWMGFDCAHLGDAPHPSFIGSLHLVHGGDTYKDSNFVYKELANMVIQLDPEENYKGIIKNQPDFVLDLPL